MINKIKKVLKEPWKILPYFRQKIGTSLYYRLSKEGYAPTPQTIFVSVNSVCNAKCQMCDVGQSVVTSQFYQHLKGRQTELDLERLKKLIDEVKSFKPFIAIVSTEPLLYGNLLEFVKYVVNNGLRLQITTNGLLLEKYAEDFVRIGVHDLWVSLDGPPEIHDKIRGIPGIFGKATAAIKNINQFKKDLGTGTPKISTNFTISPLNDGSLVKFLESIRDLNLDTITFSHMNFVTNAMAEAHNRLFEKVLGQATSSCVSAVNPTKVNIKNLCQQIKTVKARFKNVSFVPDLNSEGELFDYYNRPAKIAARRRCTVTWDSAQILANGDLIPITRCFMADLGNIYEGTFEEIWNGLKMREFRKKIRKIKLTSACTRCCGVLYK